MNINERSTCRRNKQQLVHTSNWAAICCSNLQQVAKSWTCSSLGNKSPGPDFRRKKRSTRRQQRATCWTNLQLVAGNKQLVARNKQLVEATGNKLLILSTCCQQQATCRPSTSCFQQVDSVDRALMTADCVSRLVTVCIICFWMCIMWGKIVLIVSWCRRAIFAIFIAVFVAIVVA